MAGFSSKSLVLVSLLGLLALLLCSTSEGEWARAFGPRKRFSVPLCSTPAIPGCACSQLAAGREWGGKELFQQRMLPNPPLLSMAIWIVRGLNSKCPRQHGSVVQMGFIYFVVFLRTSTKQPGLLPVLHQSASASVGPKGLYWTALQWSLRYPCDHVSYFSEDPLFFLTCINLRMSVWAETMIWIL